jgi:hypothetical protein
MKKLLLLVAIPALLLTTNCAQQTENESSLFGKRTANRKHDSQKNLKSLNVRYDYDATTEETLESSVNIFLNINEQTIGDEIAAKVVLQNLTDSTLNKSEDIEIERLEGNKAKINITGLLPNGIYRAWINIHSADNELSDENVIGTVPYAFYFVTAGPSELEQKRRSVVMPALKHYYMARLRQAGNLDCWQFTKRYAATQFPSWNRKTHSGRSIPALAVEGSIVGDYVRIPDYHSMLILGYDKKNNRVWTVEGNFNSTIEIVSRTDYGNWWITHQK